MTVNFMVKTTDGYIRDAAEPFQYPGGEWHLREVCSDRDPRSVWIADVRFGSETDLIQAALFADVAHQRQAPFVLLLPYLPAARADKVPMLDEPIGVAVYSQLVNSMNPQQVIGIDAHSPIVHRHLRNLTELSSVPLLKQALGYKDARRSDWLDRVEKYDAVIAPDKGALDRAGNAAADLDHYGVDLYHADKVRDHKTGKILGITMAETLPGSGRYLVVDDICDGGGTFMGLADAIDLPKEQLGLWVTHGIFSGNAINLRLRYGHIYTTDSHPGSGRTEFRPANIYEALSPNMPHGPLSVATSITHCETYMLQNLKEFG